MPPTILLTDDQHDEVWKFLLQLFPLAQKVNMLKIADFANLTFHVLITTVE